VVWSGQAGKAGALSTCSAAPVTDFQATNKSALVSPAAAAAVSLSCSSEQRRYMMIPYIEVAARQP